MEIYIYKIINKTNNKMYIGQTTNFYRRKNTHISKLKQNTHPNVKLQSAWNKYGEENFSFEKEKFHVENQKEIDNLEIKFIKQFDSFNNGYNLTTGGQGGYAPYKKKRNLDFNQYCFAYIGNTSYQGLMNETAKKLNCNSSTISAIVNKNAYPDFKDRFEKLPPEEKQFYLNFFKNEFKDKLTCKIQKERTTDELTFKILCMVSTYSRGIEAAILKKFNMSKSFTRNVFLNNGYKEVKEKFSSLSKEEIITLGKQYFEEYNIIEFNHTLKIQYTDLFKKYKK